jgi:hypothetical protein
MCGTRHSLSDSTLPKAYLCQPGRRNIRPYMPEQHRAFYESLEYVFISIRGQDGRPCAFCVAGEKGFISSPSPTELVVDLHHGSDTGEGKGVMRSLGGTSLQMLCTRSRARGHELQAACLCRSCNWQQYWSSGLGNAYSPPQSCQWDNCAG